MQKSQVFHKKLYKLRLLDKVKRVSEKVLFFHCLFCINYLGLAKLNYVEFYFKLLNKLYQWGLLLMPQQNQQQQMQQAVQAAQGSANPQQLQQAQQQQQAQKPQQISRQLQQHNNNYNRLNNKFSKLQQSLG